MLVPIPSPPRALPKIDSPGVSGWLGCYESILDQAVKQRFLKLPGDYHKEVADLAQEMGIAGAGARDVVNLHRQVLAKKTTELSTRQFAGYTAEGRLLLVELLGYLLSHYQQEALHPTTPETE